MKIGYILQAGAPNLTAHPLSGPAIHVVRICEWLRTLGHTVTVLAFQDNGLWKSSDNVNFTPVHVAATDEGLKRRFESGVRRVQNDLRLTYVNAFESQRFAAGVGQELGDCDLLYERQGWMGYGGALAARRYRIPLILEVNGDHLAEFEMLGLAPRGVQRKLSLDIMRWATHQAAFVVATGEGWRKRIVEQWGIDPAHTGVIENGSEMVERLERPDLRAFQPAVEDGSPVRLAYVGALEPWHGVSVLIQALAKAVDCGAHVHLDLIGDGSEGPSLRAAIAERELSPFVTLHGFMTAEQFAPLLAQAEIGLSPYCGRVEYSGLKLLDYKAAGLAIIASGADGQPAILRHGATGWIVPPCDVESLAGAIVQLAASGDERRRLGQAARIEAEALHSWRHTALELDALFRQVVGA